jgi:hypothetical protein
MEGRITQKDGLGNMSLESEHGVVRVKVEDILSITRLPQQS